MKLQRFIKNKRQIQILIASIIGVIVIIGGISLYRTFALYKEEETFNVLQGTVPDFCYEGHTWEYKYTGNEQVFKAICSGIYQVELWGAQGGSVDTTYVGGLGSYTSGNIELEQGKKLYVYVGEYPTTTKLNQTIFNSGTDSQYYSIGSVGYGMAGGGATDVRLVNGNWNDFDSLKSRIMVAASGSGAQTYSLAHSGIAGGGLVGYNGLRLSGLSSIDPNITRIPTGGTQTSPGQNGGGWNDARTKNAGFGFGGITYGPVSRGGAGYYGGGGSPHYDCIVGTGGSGSSFISGHEGCDAITEESTETDIQHTGQPNHYSNLIFTDTKMIDGMGYSWTDKKENQTNMPKHDGTNGTMVGNSGNGYAKITYLGKA